MPDFFLIEVSSGVIFLGQREYIDFNHDCIRFASLVKVFGPYINRCCIGFQSPMALGPRCATVNKRQIDISDGAHTLVVSY
jgi:hypothetical protein